MLNQSEETVGWLEVKERGSGVDMPASHASCQVTSFKELNAGNEVAKSFNCLLNWSNRL